MPIVIEFGLKMRNKKTWRIRFVFCIYL